MALFLALSLHLIERLGVNRIGFVWLCFSDRTALGARWPGVNTGPRRVKHDAIDPIILRSRLSRGNCRYGGRAGGATVQPRPASSAGTSLAAGRAEACIHHLGRVLKHRSAAVGAVSRNRRFSRRSRCHLGQRCEASCRRESRRMDCEILVANELGGCMLWVAGGQKGNSGLNMFVVEHGGSSGDVWCP